MGELRPGALAEGLRLITQKTVSILARGPYNCRGKARCIGWRNSASGMPRRRLDGSRCGLQRAARVSVIGFGIELRVRQHHSNGHGPTSGVHQAGQSTRVAPRTLSRLLRKNDLAIHIDHDQPLQKVSVACFSALVLLDAAYEMGADGVLRKPGVGRGRTATSATADPEGVVAEIVERVWP